MSFLLCYVLNADQLLFFQIPLPQPANPESRSSVIRAAADNAQSVGSVIPGAGQGDESADPSDPRPNESDDHQDSHQAKEADDVSLPSVSKPIFQRTYLHSFSTC